MILRFLLFLLLFAQGFTKTVIKREIPEKMTVSVIIPCSGEQFQHLDHLLHCYEKQTCGPDEIVISFSSENEFDHAKIQSIKNHPWPFQIKLYQSYGKQSASLNRNIAARRSSGDVLIFQDVKTIPHPQRVEITKFIFENYFLDHLMHPSAKFPPKKNPDYDKGLVPFIVFDSFDEAARSPIFRTRLRDGDISLSRRALESSSWECEIDSQFHREIYQQFPNTALIPWQLVAQKNEWPPFIDSFLPYYPYLGTTEFAAIAKWLYEGINENFDPNAEYRIPKRIHFIWLGSPLPKECEALIHTWEILHPTWEIKVWKDQDVAAFGLQNQAAFDHAKNFGEKSDIFRYEILYRYGGVYADVDFECLQPLDKIHQSCEFYTGMVSGQTEHVLLNGIIGSRPGHPIMKACINQITIGPADHDPDGIFQRSGPALFTKAFFTHLSRSDKGKVVAFPPSFFYAYPATSRWITDRQEIKETFVRPESFAVHYWESRWKKH